MSVLASSTRPSLLFLFYLFFSSIFSILNNSTLLSTVVDITSSIIFFSYLFCIFSLHSSLLQFPIVFFCSIYPIFSLLLHSTFPKFYLYLSVSFFCFYIYFYLLPIIMYSNIVTTQPNFYSIQSIFNPGWGYMVIGLIHPTHTQTFNPVPGNLEQ